jgi:protein involved in polysaccharide export with SLBB domain
MKYSAIRNAVVFFIISALVFIWPLKAQESDQGAAIPIAQVQIALSSPSYPVTSGDVYSLTYMAGGTPVSYLITVDASYRIRVSNLAVIDVVGKTYPALKKEAETIVSNNYPLSGAQLTMIKPSSFTIYIKGEVNSAGERTTWAMGRLSSVLGNALYDYSSTRNITVTAANGRVKTYDLFKAQRFGDLSDDPYLRPGDVITVNPLDRRVYVYGQVKRPGSYELLPGEHIQELIRNYANGYTSGADTSEIELTRHGEDKRETIYLTQEEINANYPLKDADAVYVLIKS